MAATKTEDPAPANGRNRSAAAAAPKNWVVDDEDSESDDDKFLGDVGDMVKGIGSGSADDTNGANRKLSLFAMTRPESNNSRPSSSSGLPKAKSRPSRAIDISDNDETNYEMLAMPSPHKPAPAPAAKDTLDSFLSDDDDLPVLTKKAPAAKTGQKAAPKPKKPLVAKKAAAPKPKAQTLSPAAKVYAAKQSKAKAKAKQDEEEEEEDDDLLMDDAPPAKPAARRPARAAAAKPKKPIYIDSDDEDEDEMSVDDLDESAVIEDDSDEF